MSKFKNTVMSAGLVLAATLAQAETPGLDSFRALSAVATAADPIELSVNPIEVADEPSASKGVFNKGDKISFEVSGIEGSTVYILNMDTTGAIHMLYPNKFQSSDKPMEDDTLMLPGEDAKYVFEVTGEPGIEVVKVIAMDGEASLLETLMDGLFDKKSAFPRALSPAQETSEQLAEFLNSDAAKTARETTFEYVIAK